MVEGKPSSKKGHWTDENNLSNQSAWTDQFSFLKGTHL